MLMVWVDWLGWWLIRIIFEFVIVCVLFFSVLIGVFFVCLWVLCLW